MDIIKWTTPTLKIQIDPTKSIESADYIIITFDSKCAHFDVLTDPSSYDESGIVEITLTQEQTGSFRPMSRVDVQANVMSGNTRMASYEGYFNVRRNLYNGALAKGSGASVEFDANIIKLTLSSEYIVREGGGSDDYEDLNNKPSINNETLVGNKTSAELGLASASDLSALTSTVSALETTVGNHTNQIQTNTTAIGSTATAISNLQTSLTTETANRESADNNLQSQIDAITSSSDVVDIVGTYAQLQSYDTSTLGNNDIVKVLEDSTHDNAMSYYRWNKSSQIWTYIGSEGAYYTKSESDSRYVPQTRTVNGKALSANITLDASDVNALPNTTTIPSKTSDLTNDSGFITSSALSGYATLNDIPTAVSELTNDSSYQTANQVSTSISTALTGYATETWVQNYIASLNATNVRY